MTNHQVVIGGACRTPISALLRTLPKTSPVDMAALVIREAVRRAGIMADQVDEVILDSVLTSGLGQNIARQPAWSWRAEPRACRGGSRFARCSPRVKETFDTYGHLSLAGGGSRASATKRRRSGPVGSPRLLLAIPTASRRAVLLRNGRCAPKDSGASCHTDLTVSLQCNMNPHGLRSIELQPALSSRVHVLRSPRGAHDSVKNMARTQRQVPKFMRHYAARKRAHICTVRAGH